MSDNDKQPAKPNGHDEQELSLEDLDKVAGAGSPAQEQKAKQDQQGRSQEQRMKAGG